MGRIGVEEGEVVMRMRRVQGLRLIVLVGEGVGDGVAIAVLRRVVAGAGVDVVGGDDGKGGERMGDVEGL